ncbi:hypothetical protein [Dyella sp. A6]|uniref:AtuA-related protein n=1 Tax=Dyella aluminiiresistens TaxID=3069105 RepID=UPI002E78368D|nr:hypothetical protein [Dyella sp. A6]
MILRQLAHARTGDKGDISNISIIAYHEADYTKLCAALNTERVKSRLEQVAAKVNGEDPQLTVMRYLLPRIWALNFVVTGSLYGGVTKSLALDAHGKTLGSLLMDMDI